MKPKILLVGPSGCGKSLTGQWLEKNIPGYKYAGSTSEYIAPHIAARLGQTIEYAYARRHENREYWKNVGDELCKDDPAFLLKESLQNGNVCAGVRRLNEIEAAKELVDFIIWIERPGTPKDPTLEFTHAYADIIVLNDTLDNYFSRLSRFLKNDLTF